MSLLRAKIVIVPLGDVDLTLVNRLAGSIGGVFNRGVDILKGMRMPQEAFNETRNQYYARIILSKLERVKANTRETIVGICEEDIYLPNRHYVLGYADNLGSTGVVSIFHFRHEFYGLPEDEKQVYPRLYKETIHQMAHIYSIPICSNPSCVHYESTEMLDIDHKSDKLCDICIRNLQQVRTT
ncbi:MAG: archaemetzincin [Candidatus Zixiibacteriota bacterium]